MNKAIKYIWGFLFLLMLCYLTLIKGALPERLAVHFDIAGNPNGFQSKDVFLNEFLGITFFINGLFLLFAWLIARIPTALINIPWKDYWFADDERKGRAFGKLRSLLGLGGIFICTVFLVLEQVIYQANAKETLFSIPVNGAMFAILTLSVFFIAFSFIITRPSD